MNTPQSDAEQIKQCQAWLKKKAQRKMDKLEKRLLRWAKVYFGKEMAIIYAQEGAVVVDEDGNRSFIKAGK